MALIRKFKAAEMSRNSVHDEISATYSTFVHKGEKFLQIDSYGREEREVPGKKSQTVQLDAEGAKALVAILKLEFRIA